MHSSAHTWWCLLCGKTHWGKTSCRQQRCSDRWGRPGVIHRHHPLVGTQPARIRSERGLVVGHHLQVLQLSDRAAVSQLCLVLFTLFPLVQIQWLTLTSCRLPSSDFHFPPISSCAHYRNHSALCTRDVNSTFEQAFPNGSVDAPGGVRDMNTPGTSFPSLVTSGWAEDLQLVTFYGQNAAEVRHRPKRLYIYHLNLFV